jgi:hypothetical protein
MPVGRAQDLLVHERGLRGEKRALRTRSCADGTPAALAPVVTDVT